MTTLNKTKFLEFKSAKSPSGHDWYYVKRTNDKKDTDSAVVITTLLQNGSNYSILLLITKRPPMYSENKSKFCLECPAGLIADDNSEESLLDCTKKELLEETGLAADELYLELTNSSTSAGLSSETLSFVTAVVKNNTLIKEPIDDGGIIHDRIIIPIEELFSYITKIDKKEISVASPTICGIYFALERLKSIK